jgi:uncharacterized protein YbjT (DUF2867 family)/uncharacterized membrane protein
MRVLILGGYGLIGLAIARGLHQEGHEVTGLGRSPGVGRRLFPLVRWVHGDLASLGTAARWKPLIAGFDVVVNAAGTLQDGPRESVERTHHIAIAALAAACAETPTVRLIQISAAGASTDAPTEFMRSKARADEAIAASAIHWVILRPGLVIGPNAYGGSALIRAIAAFPIVIPIVFAEKRIQAVALTDLVRVVLEAVEGRIPANTAVDVVEDEPHTLREIIEGTRQWLGFRRPLAIVSVPQWIAAIASIAADALGFLGWRSPLRSTAIRSIEHEILGDAAPLRRIRGESVAPLESILAGIPAGIQERWFARTYLLMPVMIATLSLFWIVSGVIGLLDIERAARIIPASILGSRSSATLVLLGSALDIAVGVAVLFRPLARLACLGMIAISAAYLVAGSILTPSLWLDPLGPFVKILPAAVLALATVALPEER